MMSLRSNNEGVLAHLRMLSYVIGLLATTAIPSVTANAQATYSGQIGVEVGDRPTGFVDAFKDQGRLFISASTGNPVPADANGNPLSDGIAVIFDNRPVPVWTGTIDDPSQYQPDCSGTYQLSFQGQATLSNVSGAPTLTLANQSYNSATNTTTVSVTLPGGPTYADGPALMEISFTNTQLTPTSGTNTGIAGLQVLRPNMPAAAYTQTFGQAGLAANGQIFDPAFIASLAPFGYLRFMGWLGTNTNSGYFGDTGHHLLTWSTRSLPTDFYQGVGTNISSNSNVNPGAWGISWEYVILLANAANKDIWINIPVSATGGSDALDPTYDPSSDSYIYQLALLLKNGDPITGNVGLNPGLHIYIEHSNEVWNSGFLQYTWNLLAAESEVNQGGSVLNNDGDTNQYDWAYRRHIKRLYEISQIFQTVFGSGSLNTTIRPVYAWWQLDEGSGSNAANALAWFQKNYGAPNNYFYAMAQADYFTASNYANDTTIPDVLSDMASNSAASVAYVTAAKATANQYGLQLFAYEGGPDNSNGGNQNTVNVGVQIEANRDPGMDTLVQNHVRNNWFGEGGNMFGYFSLSGAYSRYGDYGSTDDYRNLTTSKYNAIVNLTGYEPNGVPFAPGDLVASGGNGTVALTWESVPGATSYNVLRSTVSGGETQLVTVTSTTYSDTAVSNGATYYYEITATNSAATSTPSNEASAMPESVPPPAPVLSGTAGNGQVALSWTTAAGATSYNVYEGTTSGGESSTPIAIGVTLSSYTVSGLTNGTTYYFEVAGVNSLGTGSFSNEVSVAPTGPPPAPTGLTATSGNGQVALSWTASSGATTYSVYEGTASGQENSTPVATGITATTYTVTGLTNSTAYYFTVAAVNAAGASGYSNEAGATPNPPSPLLAYEPFGEVTGVLQGASGGGDFGWSAAWTVQNSLTDVPGYNVASTNPLSYTGLATSGNYAVGGDEYVTSGRALDVTAAGPFSAYLSNGLIDAPGQSIWLSFMLRQDASGAQPYVGLTNNGGGSAWYSSVPNIEVGYFGASSNNSGSNPMWSLQYNGTTEKTNVPVLVGQPALFVVEDTFGSNGSPDQINLYVNPTSLGGAAPATPSVQYSPSGSTAFQGIAYYGGNSPGQSSLDEIRVGTTYAAVTPASAGTAPAAPTGLTATPGNAQVALAWTASTGATSYNVYEATTSGGEGSTPVATGVTGTSYTVSGLTNGTNYYFEIAAVNSAGTSGVSIEASASPSAPIQIPSAPTGLTATAGPAQVTLTWTGSTGAATYNVYEGTASGGESATPVATGITATTYSVNGLAAGTAYYFTVASVNSAGTSGYSNEATATPSTGYVGPVSISVPNYSFELDNQSAYIVPQDWSATTSGTSSVVSQICNAACNTSLTNITGTYYWNPSVGNNGSEPYGTGTSTLTTAASLGTFAANSEYTLTVALAANNPSASSVGFELLANGVAVANFTAPITGSNALSSNALQDYSLTFSTLDTPSVVGQSITIALIYTYTGQYDKAAQFDNVRLTQALESGLAPLTPAGLTATPGNGQVDLSWTGAAGATSYNVYQGTASGAEGATPVATGVTATTYTVAGLADGMPYYFTVAAVNSSGVSGFSNEASAIPQFVYGSATPITVPNYSFELDQQANYIVPQDWTFTSSGTDGDSAAQYIGSNANNNPPFTGVDGAYYWSPGANNQVSQPYGTTTAILTSAAPLGTFAANTQYSLTVALGDNGDSDPSNYQVGFQLLANNVPVATYIAPTAGTNALPPGCNCGPTGLADYSLTFSTAGQPQLVGQNITVALTYTFSGQYSRSAYFDNVRLTQAQAEVQPSAPTGLTATAGNGQATLSWTASTGATSYNVYEGTSPGGENSTPIATGITGTSYSATGLTGGTAYYFTVAAVNSTGTSGYSNEASVSLLASPTALTATAGSGQVLLSWTASTGAASYNVYEGTASGGESATPVATAITATSYTLTGLTNGTPYYFTVAAVNASGTSGFSNETVATPSAPVTAAPLAYEPFGEATEALNGASGSGDSGWGDAWVEQSGSVSVPGYNIVSATPLTYTGLLTTPGYAIGGYQYQTAGRQLDVSAGGTFASYLNSNGMIGAPGQTVWLSFLLRQDANGGDPAVGLTAQAGGNSWWTNPTNIEIGYFGASSNDSDGNPWWSLQYNGTTLQTNVPVVKGQTTLFVIADTFGSNGQPDQINLYANPVSLGGAAPATPTLQYSPSGSTAFESITYYGGDNINESSLGDIRVGASYASVTPAVAVPVAPAPTGLTAQAGNAQVALSWTVSTGAATYNVYEGTASGGESTAPVATGITATTYAVTGLTNGTAYYFTVAAVNTGGVSGYSNEASATPSIQYATPTPISVPNYSFELDNQSNYIVPQDWTLTSSGTTSAVQQICSDSACNNTLSNVTGTYYWSPGIANNGSAPYGNETATLTTSAPLGIFGSDEQYTLTVALAAANPSSASQVGFELLADGVPVATFVAPTTGTNAINSAGLQDYSLTFSTVNQPSVVGENMTVALIYTYTGQYLRSAYFDNVRLTQATEVGAPVPVAPTSLTATAGSEQAMLTWGPVAGATSYDVYQGTTSGGEGTTPIATGVDSSSYTATGLSDGTTYYFVVTAVNSDGASGISNEASATPSASLGIPAAPSGVTATSGDMTATLSWPAVPGASSYNIYEATTAGGEGTTPVATGVTSSPYSVTALTDETTYFFKIAAVNSYGTSGLSNEVTATPAPAVGGTNSPASFSIYPQVVAANPVKVGFSIAPTAGGGQIGENAWLADGGMNARDEHLSMTADTAGSATTFIDQNNGGGTSFYQSIATGFFVGATARTYRYANGAWSLLRTDTVTGYETPAGADTPTAANSTITFASSGPVTEPGDIIWLDIVGQPTIPNVSQLNSRFTSYYPTWSTETQTGQSLTGTWPVTLSTDVPANDTGNFSAEITDNNTEMQGIWQYVQGAFVGPADEEFQPGHTYEFDVWLKQSGIANSSATVSLNGLGISHTFTGITDSWQEFTWTFPAPAGLPANSSQPTVHLDYSAPGTLWVDNFQLYDSAYPPNSVNPQVMQAWQNYQPATVRIWSNFSDSGGGYGFWDLDSWIQPEIKSWNATGIGNEYEQSVQLEHLPAALANVKTIGTANPWLIVNMAMSEVEWGELIDYLSAPAGVGYAAKRPANHPGPYTDDFNSIYLEVGNEEWGTQQVPADAAYGQWAHFVLSNAIAGKSYFNPSQIKFIVNGFVLEPNFGSAAIAAAPEASYTEAALYSNGNTSLSGDPYYQSDLVQLPVTNGPLINALVAQQQLDASNGRVYGLAAYEEGPGGSTTPGDDTLAAAIGAVDVNLYASQEGFGPQNFFLYNLGTGPWSSHTNFANGFRPHPVWEAMQMRNNYTSGPIVLTTTNSVPTYSDPTITNGQAVPLISVYTFQDANITNQADVVVISRDLNNQTPVTLNFPATPTGTAQLYMLTGDPRASNDEAMNIPITNTTVSGLTTSYTFTMPPGSMYILQVPMSGPWSSSGEPTPPPPAGLSANAGNGEVTLTWGASSGATSYNVLRSTTNGGPYTQIGTSTDVAYTDSSVANGTTYYYVVQAVNGGGASANSEQAEATPNVEDASMTTVAPPLDGSDTGAWANVPFVPLTHSFDGNSTDTAAYKVLWDSNNLYVLVSVQDSYLIAPTLSNIYDGETVELYFSGTDTKSTTYGPTDFQYAFPYGNGGAVVTETYHSPSSLTGVQFGQQNITGGYEMAMALPWTTLGTTPVQNQQYGFDVMIDTASAQGTLLGKLGWWATVNDTWDNPSLMGPLVLTQPTTSSQTISFVAPSNAVYGSSIPLNATASSGLAPAYTLVSGPASLNGSELTFTGVGQVVVEAMQAGNSSYSAATPVSQTITVTAAPLTISANSFSRIYGAANPIFTGSVSGAVNGDSFTESFAISANTSSTVGTYSIVPSVTGTNLADYNVTTQDGTLTVTQATPTITWAAPQPITYGTALTASQLDAASTTPGVLTYSPGLGAVLTAGAQTLSVALAPTDLKDYTAASTTVPLTVNKAVTSLALTASSNPAAQGKADVITATVTGAGQLGGSVVFSSGSTTLCTSSLSGAGTAICSFTPSASGALSISAQYLGDANHLASSATLPLNVYDTSVTEQFSSTTLVYPGATNVTVCVAGATKATATGTVRIEDGSTVLTTQSLQGGGCAYWYISPGLNAGAHSITAVYSGDANNPAGASQPTTLNVSPVPVNMSVSCWNSSFAYGANYQCTVNISSNAGSALGSITYSFDGGAPVAVPLSSGNAGFTITEPLAGNHTVAIGYAQQTNYAAASTQTESFTVTPAPINLALTPSTWYTTSGTSITFQATVTSWSAGPPDSNGSVSFFDGSTLLATVPVNSSGVATYSTSSLPVGSDTITATYAGGANYASGSTSVSITIVK